MRIGFFRRDYSEHACDNPDHAGLRQMLVGDVDPRGDHSWMGQDVFLLYMERDRHRKEASMLYRQQWKEAAQTFLTTLAITAAVLVSGLVFLFLALTER